MENSGERNFPKLKGLIVILAALLILSAGGLAARYLWLGDRSSSRSTVTVPGNLIGEAGTAQETASETTNRVLQPATAGTATAGTAAAPSAYASSGSAGSTGADSGSTAVVLELYQGQSKVNEPFSVQDMLPGDSVTRYFCVKLSHDRDVTLYFTPEITEETKGLGDVLHVKVTHLETGKVLCDSFFSPADGQAFSELIPKSGTGETVAYYRIDVSVDTSVGNEYQATALTANFRWYVKEHGGLTPPQTGDTADIVLWAVLALSSLSMLALLALRRRKGDEHHR